jgi:antitoxin MazE
MLISIVSIEDSKGIKFPQNIVDEFNIGDEVELEILEEGIMLKPPARKPRQGWNERFKKLHDNADDVLLIPDNIENQSFNWEW